MNFLRKHLTYANIVATMALLFAMGGTAVAAKHYVVNSTKQINPKVLRKLEGRAGRTGPAGGAGAAGAQGLQGKEGAPGQPAPSTLASGQSESGIVALRSGETVSGDSLDTSVTFRIPLSATLDVAHVVFAHAKIPVAHCSEPGTADPGYLCIYTANEQAVNTSETETFISEGSFPEGGAGRLGFTIEWHADGAHAYVLANYTVTAP